MKKSYCILLCLILILSLSSCSLLPESTTDTQNHTENQTASTGSESPSASTSSDDAPISMQLPITAVSLPVNTEYTFAKDDTCIFFHTAQDVALIAPNAQVADQIVLKMLQKIDTPQLSLNEIITWAENNYTPSENWVPYFYQVRYNPVRLDEKVLSFYGNEVSYTGGIHPNRLSVSANYDMSNGELLTLGDILIDENAAYVLSQSIIDMMVENRDTFQLYDGFAATVTERFTGKAVWAEQSDWYLSTKGLCVFFSPYDIAPYAVGSIVLEIPYQKLNGILKDEFFPAALPEATGNLYASLAQDVDLDQYSQFAEATLDPDGERFVLYSDALITDIRIEQGTWNESGTLFTTDAVVFASSTLSLGDALMIQAQFPDVLPSLRVRYTSGGRDHLFYILQSGKDGSVFLSDLS